MSDGRKYFCFCEANCKFETMTKEQILAAIAQAAEGGLVFDVDAAFISKVKESNAGSTLTFWKGTRAQYNAIPTKDDNCFYIITDEQDGASAAQLAAIEIAINDLQENVKQLQATAWTESTENPGCHYRMVDGEVEWQNPPMEGGVAYRTTKRYFGKPVYATLVNIGAIAANAVQYFDVGVEGDVIDKVVTLNVTAHKSTAMYPFPAFGSAGGAVMFLAAKNGARSFYVKDNGSTGNFEIVAYVEYTLA